MVDCDQIGLRFLHEKAQLGDEAQERRPPLSPPIASHFVPVCGRRYGFATTSRGNSSRAELSRLSAAIGLANGIGLSLL